MSTKIDSSFWRTIGQKDLRNDKRILSICSFFISSSFLKLPDPDIVLVAWQHALSHFLLAEVNEVTEVDTTVYFTSHLWSHPRLYLAVIPFGNLKDSSRS